MHSNTLSCRIQPENGSGVESPSRPWCSKQVIATEIQRFVREHIWINKTRPQSFRQVLDAGTAHRVLSSISDPAPELALADPGPLWLELTIFEVRPHSCEESEGVHKTVHKKRWKSDERAMAETA